MIKIKDREFNVEAYEVLQKIKLETFGKLRHINKYEDYVMLSCPYHKNGQERKPSAMLRNDGSFYCFSCNTKKHISDIIYDLLKVDAYDFMVNNYDNVELRSRSFKRNKFSSAVNQRFVDKKELERYRFYHPYMQERGISLDIVKKFDIGYSKELNAIMFPIKDEQGNILYFMNRSLDKKRYAIKKHVDKPLYGVYELLREKNVNEVYLVEGIFDCLSVWEYGKYALAMHGLGSLKQIEQLEKLPIRTIIIATDNDERGQQAKERLSKLIKNKFIKTINYNNNKKDINEMTKEEFLNLEIIDVFRRI